MVYGALWGGGGGDPPEGHLLASWGDAGLLTCLRSAAKPFQVLPVLLDGVDAAFGLGDEELAVAIGSHSGQEVHLEVVRQILKKAGLEEGDLQCGRHRPFQKYAACAVGSGYTALHNNCSGKHAAMLAWCVHRGVDPAGYLSPEHPLQRRILDLVSLLSGVERSGIQLGIDGCGVPTFGMPLGAMARMFGNLTRPGGQTTGAIAASAAGDAGRLGPALERVADLMAMHPMMIAGEDRPDTAIIRSTGGRVLTKAGAEGLWCGVDRERGTAFAFKAIDGGLRACVPALLEALVATKAIHPSEAGALKRHHRPVLQNHAGTPVGRVVPHLGYWRVTGYSDGSAWWRRPGRSIG